MLECRRPSHRHARLEIVLVPLVHRGTIILGSGFVEGNRRVHRRPGRSPSQSLRKEIRERYVTLHLETLGFVDRTAQAIAQPTG